MQIAKHRLGSNQLIADINFVSFFGIMLVLLYVLTSPWRIGAHPSWPDVYLPQVKHPIEMSNADRDDAVVITILRDGRVVLGNDQVEPSALTMKIKDRLKRGLPQIVYFRIDTRVDYRHVSEALDSVRMSGLEKIAFLVEKPNKGQEQ